MASPYVHDARRLRQDDGDVTAAEVMEVGIFEQPRGAIPGEEATALAIDVPDGDGRVCADGSNLILIGRGIYRGDVDLVCWRAENVNDTTGVGPNGDGIGHTDLSAFKDCEHRIAGDHDI